MPLWRVDPHNILVNFTESRCWLTFLSVKNQLDSMLSVKRTVSGIATVHFVPLGCHASHAVNQYVGLQGVMDEGVMDESYMTQ